jgi:hypothetical protein
MIRTPALAALLFLAVSTPVMAQQNKFAGYTISRDTAEVNGVMLHGGYSAKQVIAFVRKSCRDGNIGPFAMATKTHRKSGFELRNFRTACPAGPAARFGDTPRLSVEHERLPDGRTLTEYFYFSGSESKRLVEFE